MVGTSQNDALERLLDPVADCLTPEVAQRIAALRANPQTQARIDDLADRHREGGLSDEELAEYDTYISAIDFITVLQAKARSFLERAAAS
jgi:hypothetical protein